MNEENGHRFLRFDEFDDMFYDAVRTRLVNIYRGRIVDLIKHKSMNDLFALAERDLFVCSTHLHFLRCRSVTRIGAWHASHARSRRERKERL